MKILRVPFSALTGFLQRIVDFLFGYDFFISYAWSDGTNYPRTLARRLQEESRFRTFIDNIGYVPGDNLRKATRRRVRMSTVLVLVLRPAAMKSDWVLKEVQTCLDAGRTPIVIDVNGTFATAADSPLKQLLADSLRITESLATGDGPPSEQTLDELKRSFKFSRRESLLLRVVGYAAALFAIIALVAAVQWDRARQLAEQERAERERAERMYGIALDELAKGLVDLGQLQAEVDPALAVRLALTAHDLHPGAESVKLLESALQRNPVWTRIGPSNPGPAKVEDASRLSPMDVFATDPDISTVLTQEPARKRERQGHTGALIVLREVPTGRTLAVLQLDSSEVMLTPRSSTTRLFATRKEGRLRVYGLSAAGMQSPLLTVDGARDVAFTAGDWPVHILTRTGEVLSYSEKEREPPLSRGIVKGARTIHAHPRGGGLVLLGSNELIWMKVGLGQKPEEHRVIPWPDLAPFDTGAEWEAWSDLRWGPTAGDLLLLQCAPADEKDAFKWSSAVHAVDLPSGRKQLVSNSVYRKDDTFRWFFESDPEGRRIVMTSQGQEAGVKMQLVDLDWEGAREGGVVKVTTPKAGLLGGHRKLTRPAYAVAAAIAPNRNFIVVASHLFRGEPHLGMGLLVSCDDKGEAPSVGCSVLQPEPVYQWGEKDPREIGTVPLLRLAYSQDSSRVLAWDIRGVYHVFRTRASRGSNRMPEAWSLRLLTPEFTLEGEYGQRMIARFGDGEIRSYDLKAHREERVPSIVAPSPVLVVHTLPQLGGLGVVTDREIIQIRDGVIAGRTALPGQVHFVLWGPELITAFADNDAYFIRTADLVILGGLEDESKAEFLSQSGSWREQAKLNSRSVSRWIQAPDGRYRLGAIKGSQLLLWVLEYSPERRKFKTFQEKVKLVVSVDDQDFWSSRRLDEPDILFVQHGTYAQGRAVASFQQYDISTGQEVSKFLPPPTGWPLSTLEIEDVRRVDGKVLMLFRYLPPDSRENHYAVGFWEKEGGSCLRWVELGKFENNPLYIQSVDGEAVAHAMFWNDSTKESASLVRLSDGAVLWSGAVRYAGIPPPYLVKGESGSWSPIATDWYDRIIHNLSIRGRDYWEHATEIQLPEEQRQRIDRLKGR
ncbi:toll/interleukin-1 receptor domain-containing protein [Hyalangium sp.]|uniref:toll/interleukin-1 receptor domain-containing protein n=1 Tax=Hyalangium sp. TaxID=2028555 RepID=UPI002D453070|nr:toll/interleukin-1 receptor domain-containing protein [Hyalangium sp.]HYH97737.1 toll/interleukin-1 receptor domain-containing protein [Hyalangium sp.]